MTFASPFALGLLLIVPLLIVIYVLMMRRRRRFAVSFASLSLIREAMPGRSRWRRLLPFALFLMSLASLAIAAARPQAVLAVPISRTTIILAMDVSRSMCSTDVAPNRLSVAQDVARSFVADQPKDTRIGIVAFSGLAQLVVPPTTDRDLLIEAVDGFTAGRGTAVGSAVLRSVDAISEINPGVTRTGIDLAGTPEAVANGKYEPDIVVLLTDGATTQGVDPIKAAHQAADRHVRIYTIGFGTSQGGQIVCTRNQLGSDVFAGPFGGGGGGFGPDVNGGQPRRQALIRDEQTLKEVADITGGSYHRAEDAEQLVSVFRNLPTQIALQEQDVEISVIFAAVGALLATVAVGLSLAWNRYG